MFEDFIYWIGDGHTQLECAFILLVVYQLKHFVADYPLQGKYMLKKFLPGWGFFFPLLVHVTVHGGMTLAIALVVNPAVWWVCLVDAGIHFTMDRLKAGPRYMGRWKPLTMTEYVQFNSILQDEEQYKSKRWTQSLNKMKGNKLFWWSFGVDQMVHHLTHYFIIYLLITT